MTKGNLLHDLHGQLVVVGSHVGGGVNGSQLVLRRSNLVMLGLSQDTQLPQFLVQILHEGQDTGFDDTEIMVIQFLALGRHCAEQSTAGKFQVFTLFILVAVDQEVFLLGTDTGDDPFNIFIAEQFQDTKGLFVQSLHRTQKRRLFIQRFTAVRAEGSRDAQRMIFYESVGSRIPCGITSGFKGCAKSARRERRSIRLAFDQFFAGEFHNDTPVRCRRNKAVMLFSGNAGHRLEPVSEVGSSLFDRPFLHCGSDFIRYLTVQRPSLFDGSLQRVIRLGRQPRLHDTVVKDKTSKDLGYFFHKRPP